METLCRNKRNDVILFGFKDGSMYAKCSDKIIENSSIFVEIENVHSLMKGISQKTFCLKNLTSKQQLALYTDLKEKTRHWDVDYDRVFIRALP